MSNRLSVKHPARGPLPAHKPPKSGPGLDVSNDLILQYILYISVITGSLCWCALVQMSVELKSPFPQLTLCIVCGANCYLSLILTFSYSSPWAALCVFNLTHNDWVQCSIRGVRLLCGAMYWSKCEIQSATWLIRYHGLCFHKRLSQTLAHTRCFGEVEGGHFTTEWLQGFLCSPQEK